MLATNGGWRTTALVAKGLAEEKWHTQDKWQWYTVNDKW